MITKNAKRLIKYAFCVAVNKTSISTKINTITDTIKNAQGNTYVLGARNMTNTQYMGKFFPFGASCYFQDLITTHSQAYSGIAFGTGTTPATEDDYALEAIISSGLNLQTIEQESAQNANGDYIYNLLLSITNTTGSPITINEVAMCCGGSSQSDSYYPGHYVLDRTVLDTPVVVPANGIAYLKYSIVVDWDI